MDRTRAALLGLFVGVAVFFGLALPTLRSLFGPAAILAVYGYVAFVAGTLTYAAVRWLSSWRAETTAWGSERPVADGETDPLVDAEMDQIRDEAK